jgi:hypothetical protein
MLLTSNQNSPFLFFPYSLLKYIFIFLNLTTACEAVVKKFLLNQNTQPPPFIPSIIIFSINSKFIKSKIFVKFFNFSIFQ